MDIFPNFIIENDKIILGKVTYHSELMQTDDKKNVIGGGWFKYDNDTKSFIFFGDSHEFGKAKIQDIKPICFNNKVYSHAGIITDSPLTKEKYNFIYRSKFQGDITLL